MVVLALAETVPEHLGGGLHFSGGHAFLEFQFISEGEIEAEQVPDVIGNGMIAIADDTANISPDLQLPDGMHGIPDKGNGFHNMDQFSKSPAFQEAGDLLGFDIIAFRLGLDILQFACKAEPFGGGMDKTA